LASAITRAASKQTYFTIRFFVDRGRAADAFRAYGYFRWVDDVIDAGAGLRPEKIAFADRQRSLLESCYRGEVPEDICAEEWMLVDLIRSDREKNSGLQMYLRNMMDVMVFDAGRRGRVISQAELTEYTRKLGIAVTEALHYFIGHDEPPPHHEARYLAVTAAHITHMLRDTMEDVRDGYFNIPREVLQMRGISPLDVNGAAYREWVCGRVELARGYFKAGRECIRQVRNLRCRLAGFAYTARFEWMLGAIERDCYCLRSAYPERKSIRAGLWMVGSALSSIFASPRMKPVSTQMEPQLARIGKR
jgi:phytoene/squalene synthetase